MSDDFNTIRETNEQLNLTPSCPNGQLYTVKSGDTMFLIAKRFNVSLQALVNANPQINDPNIINPGQIICIPSPGAGVPCRGGQSYRVVKGDTMYEIAKRFGISLENLIRANPQIKDPSEIFPGQEICIPVAPQPVSCSGGALYTVKSGDTMFEIAKRNQLSLSALIAANPQISNPDRIFPGQVICIPASAVTPAPMPMPMPMPMPTTPTPMPQLPMTSPPATTIPPMAQMPSMPSLPTAPAYPMPGMPSTPLARPCPPNYGQMPISPMPVYVVVPWDECPYRAKTKHRRNKKCH